MAIGTHDGDQADSTFDYVVNNLEPQQTRGVIKGNLKDMDVQIEHDPVMNRMAQHDETTNQYDTKLSPEEEKQFQGWKSKNAPNDSGADYDLRGAYIRGFTPDPQSGHWPDTFKKPNHPTFSDQSIYAKDRPDLAGRWEGDKYIPASGASGMPAGAIKGSTPILPAGEFKINTKHDVKSGAVAGKDNNTVYIDPSIPHEFHPFLAVHEETEKRLMAGGMNYDQSHIIATLAEKHAVEGSGMTWDKYTDAIDPYVAKAEKGSGKNPPPDPHVNIEDAIGHHAYKASALEHADKKIAALEMPGSSPRDKQPFKEPVRIEHPLDEYKGEPMEPGEAIPDPLGHRGLYDPETGINWLIRTDLDARSPRPLPVLPPVPSIAPHNPNPPGGGPYRIRPGEKLSMVLPNTKLEEKTPPLKDHLKDEEKDMEDTLRRPDSNYEDEIAPFRGKPDTYT